MPKNGTNRQSRGRNLGQLLSYLGKHDEAEAAYRDALTIYEKLAADFPTVPKYREELAKASRERRSTRTISCPMAIPTGDDIAILAT